MFTTWSGAVTACFISAAEGINRILVGAPGGFLVNA